MRYFICRYLITFVNGCNFGWRVYKSMHAEYHWWVDWGLFWVKDDQGAMVSTSASWRQSVLYVPDHFHNEPLRWRGSDLQVNGHIICLSTMGDLEQKILTPLGNEVQCFNLHSCITTILALHGSPLILVPGISGWIFSLRAKWPPVLYVINSHKLLAFPICHFWASSQGVLQRSCLLIHMPVVAPHLSSLSHSSSSDSSCPLPLRGHSLLPGLPLSWGLKSLED